MYKRQDQIQDFRFYLIYFLLLFIFLYFSFTLFKNSILANNYYQHLAETNRTKEKPIIAYRGVFLDRTGQVLVRNKQSQAHGYQREYLYPQVTAHLLGYLALPDQVNLDDYSCGDPPLTQQYVGKAGLEKAFECQLRGRAGKKLFEVDAFGKEGNELAVKEPQKGQNLNLSILLKLQNKAHEAMQGYNGAIVASKPQTGEILLFYSSPSFDNNLITKKNNVYLDLLNDSNKPLFNRLTLGIYPPGSVIKPIIALGALEEKVIDSRTEYEDTGIFKLGGVEFGNWYFLQYGKKEEAVNVVKAIKRSNDIFFYHLGIEMQLNKLNKWFRIFSLNKQSLSEYFPQSFSLIPTNKWKITNVGEPWYLGDTVNLSIGQGYLLVNPFQLHQAISTIANQGKTCAPSFIKDDPEHCEDLNIDQANINLIKEGMIQACSNGGTGWPFFDYKVKQKSMVVACKTGTAESQQKEALPHAWFTVYAPAENPEIVLTVLVENGGEGSTVAAPIARKILTAFFSND